MVQDAETIKKILAHALEKASPDERDAYLAQACEGNSQMRAEVDSLVQAFLKADKFLEAGPFESELSLSEAQITEGPGSVIGPYKLLERIGEGGFGVVYMAEQEQPIRRRVALKIIKLGMDTRRIIARFEAERQALALMDHPNIAKVLDAGATDTGRPYFVMELVQGISITAYCDQNRLSTRDRLGLFIDICHAVQHAHQKGIIHRDIKPSNVLVTMHDGRAIPKVIDFGVAKATHQRLTEKTLFTRYAQVVGTPSYMSPEQAQMGSMDIDTRTDIYSLGVLLYELLTGTTPFDAQDLLAAGYVEMQRIIRDEEPVRPSSKLNTLGETLTTVAEFRQTLPMLLPKLVRGDLDWVTMKALEKNRSHRYETANELARDIELHLSDEAVSAGPPSVLYQMQKFIQRHRRAVLTLSAVGVVICVVVLASRFHAIAEWRRHRRALTEAFIILSQQLYDYEKVGQAPEVYTQETLTTMTELAHEFKELRVNLAYLANRFGWQQHDAGSIPTAHAYWDRACSLWEELAAESPGNAFYLHELAWAQVRYPSPYPSHAGRAIKLSQRAIALNPQKSFYWQTLGEAYSIAAQYRNAVNAFEKEHELSGTVNHHSLLRLSLASMWLGQKDRARQYYDRAAQWRRDHPEFKTNQIFLQLEAENLIRGDFWTLDDFDHYDAAGGTPVQDTWRDGPGSPDGNGSGAALYIETPESYLTQEEVVRSLIPEHPTAPTSFHALLYAYDNRQTGRATCSEIERRWERAQDWRTPGFKELSLRFQGFPPSAGRFTENPDGTYSLAGAGTDIWGPADRFHFAYKTLSGAGSIITRIDKLDAQHPWSKAGIMIRETLKPDAKHYFACAVPCEAVSMINRGSIHYGHSNARGFPLPHWYKLERDDSHNFSMSHSENGVDWEPLEWGGNIPMPNEVYIGLAVTSHDPAQTARARFSHVTIRGQVETQWQHRDIGIYSNDAEPLYLMLEDRTGTRSLVQHPDPKATQSAAWQEWSVSLQAFAEQGLDLTQVTALTIGIGEHGNTNRPGGTGRLYIDDIRIYRPRELNRKKKNGGDS